jgi:hypothetical protein
MYETTPPFSAPIPRSPSAGGELFIYSVRRALPYANEFQAFSLFSVNTP